MSCDSCCWVWLGHYRDANRVPTAPSKPLGIGWVRVTSFDKGFIDTWNVLQVADSFVKEDMKEEDK